jgi:hypothetical protein
MQMTFPDQHTRPLTIRLEHKRHVRAEKHADLITGTREQRRKADQSVRCDEELSAVQKGLHVQLDFFWAADEGRARITADGRSAALTYGMPGHSLSGLRTRWCSCHEFDCVLRVHSRWWCIDVIPECGKIDVSVLEAVRFCSAECAWGHDVVEVPFVEGV